MKKLTKISIFSIVVAIALSVGIVRSTSQTGMPPCWRAPACEYGSEKGELVTIKQGYPLTYREKQIYKPEKPIHYATAGAEQEGMSIPHILINIIFWYALLELIYGIMRDAKPSKKVATKK